MKYWLLKSEPETWSWEMQKKKGAKGEPWSGVRNHTAALHAIATRNRCAQHERLWLGSSMPNVGAGTGRNTERCRSRGAASPRRQVNELQVASFSLAAALARRDAPPKRGR